MAKKNVSITVDEEVLAHMDAVSERMHLSRSAFLTVMTEFAYENPSIYGIFGMMQRAAQVVPDSAESDLAMSALVAK